MTTSRWITAALAVATAAALAACGGENAAAPGPGVDPAAAEQSLQGLATRIYGTAEQRRDAEELQWWKTQTAIAACARQKGISYPVAAFTPVTNPDRPPAAAETVAFAPVQEDFGVGQRLQRQAAAGEPQNSVYLALTSDADRAAYMSILQTCQNAAGPDAAVPPRQADLADQLAKTLAEVEQAPDVKIQIASYGACLKQNGLDAATWLDLLARVETAYPPLPTRPTDVTTDPRWQAAFATERKAAAVDAGCRRDLHAQAVTRAQPALARFAADNAAALHAIDAQWAAISTQATTMRATAATGQPTR